MMRFIMPIILITISITLFFVFANPIYNEISVLRGEVASYNEALDNSKALENERDKLTAKYNAINPENLTKIAKLLPENVDNIRLILEIEQIALPYGMVLPSKEAEPLRQVLKITEFLIYLSQPPAPTIISLTLPKILKTTLEL